MALTTRAPRDGALDDLPDASVKYHGSMSKGMHIAIEDVSKSSDEPSARGSA